jgi:hypothetical protein
MITNCPLIPVGITKRSHILVFFLVFIVRQVRKEKLGDRITALHQMVSPFGKVNQTQHSERKD